MLTHRSPGDQIWNLFYLFDRISFDFLQAVAFICGLIHYGISALKPPDEASMWGLKRWEFWYYYIQRLSHSSPHPVNAWEIKNESKARNICIIVPKWEPVRAYKNESAVVSYNMVKHQCLTWNSGRKTQLKSIYSLVVHFQLYLSTTTAF